MAPRVATEPRVRLASRLFRRASASRVRPSRLSHVFAKRSTLREELKSATLLAVAFASVVASMARTFLEQP